MTKRLMLCLFLSACAAGPATSGPDVSVSVDGPTSVGGDDPVAWADPCDVLPEHTGSDPDCCAEALGCAPLTGACAPQGACLDYVCPLTDGRTALVGVCTAPDGGGS